MSALYERLYYKSPTFLQNVATSLYGLHLHRQRYGPASARFVEELMASERHSADAIQAAQDAALARLVRHACGTTEHYAALFRQHGIDPASIRTTDDLRRIPPLERQTLRHSGEALRSGVVEGTPIVLHTSGTSGSPTAIYTDRLSRIRHYSFATRWRRSFGVEMGMPRATISGRIIVPHGQTKPPFWRYDWSERNTTFSSYHLSEANLPSYCAHLLRIRPAEVTGYPSSVYAVARHFVQAGLPPLRPKFVNTSAEMLLEHQRDTIQRAFDAPVADQYGCTEMAVFIAQCERGTYHVHPEYGIVEVVDDDGRAVPPGVEGDILCTSFVNPVMPLIRYRIGDRIALGSGTCACGRNFPIVDRIIGRLDDVLETPDGRPIGRLDPIFKNLTGIAETQIVQRDRHHLELRIVRDSTFTDHDLRELLYETRKRVGDAMAIEVTYVDQIPRGKNGKFPAVISHLKGARRGPQA